MTSKDIPKGVFVTGIGTEVGKTVASAVLVQALEADYWKPVQSGDLENTDTDRVRQWTTAGVRFHSEAYRLRTPMSPHASAAIDGVRIDISHIHYPPTHNFLIVEGAGGLMVPLNGTHCIIDLIERLGFPVMLVSRHYLGSINHTLLSLEALKRRNIPIAGLIFNGEPHPTTEEAIESLGGCSDFLRLRLPAMPAVDKDRVAQTAERWKAALGKWKTGLDHGF